MPIVKQRIENVRKLRAESSRAATQKLAEYPTLFGENRQPKSEYVGIPLNTSGNRIYIPFGYFTKDVISNNTMSVVANASLSHFGILTSIMHMTWVKFICGRIKSDYRYSNELVYNNYPFPKDVSDKNKKIVETKAQAILDIRAEFTDSSLADLYDPLAMPPKLKRAHQGLDKAVDKCYTTKAFKNDKERIEFLFELYEEYLSANN
jgi:hypothetical protein